MGIDAEKTVSMVKDDHIAVPLEIIGKNYRAAVNGMDVGPCRHRKGKTVAERERIEFRMFMLAEPLDDLALDRQG